jgi:DNA-binding NarL/FixJ family response regulator
MTVRVVVADDHPIVRDGLRVLLDSLPDMELVGEATTGREAVRSAVVDRPDVIVMDLRMPDLDGATATAEICRTAPDVAVLVLTMLDDDDWVFAAMRAGARGYLVKGSDTNDVIRAITAVGNGEAIFGPSVARRIMAFLTRPLSAYDEHLFPELSTREREVLDLIAGGLTNAAIAVRLGLSAKTVGNHTSAIFAKLQVAGRAEAIIRAREAGLGR